MRHWSRTSTSWSPRSSTICTWPTSGRSATIRCCRIPTRCGWRARWSTTRRRICARRTPEPGSRAAICVDFAKAVLAELDTRKRRLGVLSYDDLLIRLADALATDDSPARARMHQRWPIVMVDEFQDTDPVQWQVIDRAFSGRSHRDPDRRPQAGDLRVPRRGHRDVPASGRQCRREEDAGHQLAQRLRARRAAAGGAARRALGDAAIVVDDVDAHHQGHRLAGAPHNDPFRLRVVRRGTLGRSGVANLPIDELRAHIGADLAADIGALLASGATFDGKPLRARDVAVIVEKHKDAAACFKALCDAGIPAVYTGDSDVFTSEAAEDWLCLLEAFDQPHRPGVVRAAAATMFFGETAETLAAGGDDADRSGRRDIAGMGRTCARTRRRGDLRGRAAAGHGRPAAVLAGRRAAHDRPGAHHPVAAGGRAPRAATACRHCGIGCADNATNAAAQPNATADWTATRPPCRS